MKAKLTEALQIAYELTADVEERYPIGLIRIRFLLEQVLNGLRVAHDEEAVYLAAEPPSSSLKPFARSDAWDDEVIEPTEEPPQPAA